MRILLVTYYFAPHARAGAVRPSALAGALLRLGHDVIVLTAEQQPAAPAGLTVVTVPDSRLGSHLSSLSKQVGRPSDKMRRPAVLSGAIRAVVTLTHRILSHPDKYRSWLRACSRWAVENLGMLNSVDAVIATSPPISVAFVGRRISRLISKPLIVDLRDLWTANLYYPYGRFRRMIDRTAERRLVMGADAITVPTRRFERILSGAYPASKVKVIFTGIPLADRRPCGRQDPVVLRIVHAGNTYGGKRDVEPLLVAIQALAARGLLDPALIRVEMYGETDEGVGATVERLGLEGAVRVMGSVPRDEVAAAVRDSALSLVLMWSEDTDALPVKVIEYLGAGKEILVMGAPPKSEIRDVLEGLPGVHFADDVAAIESVVLATWIALQDRGTPAAYPPERSLEFRDSRMAEQFIEVINSMGIR